MTLPKVVIVGEAPLSPDLSGIGQTIYNLFLEYPQEKVLSFVPEERKHLFDTNDVKKFLSGPFRNKVAVYNPQKIPLLRNRIGLYINKYISKFNMQWMQWLGPTIGDAVLNFNPDLVLICPNEEEGLLEGYLLAKKLKLPFVIYFMDDWVHLSSQKWVGGDIQSLTHKVLSESVGWIMISSQLKNILQKRYKVEPRRVCIAHNPVVAEDKPYIVPQNREKKRIVYAGSIWPMHYDSLLAIAQGTHLLRKEGFEVELVIYSFEHFWEQNKEVFSQLGVIFGGRVAYKDLQPLLQEADVLLVASTFGEQYKPHTLSSLQTKVTDYMIAGRAILACGPGYAACNLFVKEWECGVSCETNNPEEVKAFLKNLLDNPEYIELLGKRGYKAAKDHFTHKVITRQLYNFLEECLNTAVS